MANNKTGVLTEKQFIKLKASSYENKNPGDCDFRYEFLFVFVDKLSLLNYFRPKRLSTYNYHKY